MYQHKYKYLLCFNYVHVFTLNFKKIDVQPMIHLSHIAVWIKTMYYEFSICFYEITLCRVSLGINRAWASEFFFQKKFILF